MELKTLTPLLKENRPIAQKVKGLCPRDSASPEPLLALAKALRVGNIAYTYAYMCIYTYTHIYVYIYFYSDLKITFILFSLRYSGIKASCGSR